ncbi:NADP-dependent oxidoreductase [Pseudoalteromonas sp. CnMc7-15]|uniref:NADP-dependent oxidoreductase n=1 Tax=unclassified Pseudoalteromonas TaxID=194690 RepID=UPI001EF478E6|nr:NADP-dependent oxidoreductase [Pseudoalteromonas sp. CnMc7-15]MCG7566941.1 NADP-dependent oxidoreductase [Pseudoalteromonas sp. CnMc7-15]
MEHGYQAMVIHAFGEPGVLKPVTLSRPKPGEHELLIKVLSTAINPIDVKTRAGIGFAAEQNKHHLPMSLGYDLFGEVVACGEAVKTLKKGDKVMGMVGFATQPGTYAQYCLARENELIKVDAVNEDAVLSGLCLSGLTAFQALSALACPKSQPIYINGANGTVGSLAAQIAARMGYQVVAISRSELPKSVASCAQQMSYDQFVAEQRKGYLLDVVGLEVGKRCLQGLSAHSRVVTIPTLSQKEIIAAANEQGVTACGVLVVKNNAQLKRIYQWYRQGHLELAHCTMPLSAAGMAHQRLEQNSSKEKVILLPWT